MWTGVVRTGDCDVNQPSGEELAMTSATTIAGSPIISALLPLQKEIRE